MNRKYLDLVKRVINLNPSDSIEKSITDRQTNVVASGFGRLHEDGGFMYLADEVGLGKTYEALGIAAMLRRFSPHPERHSEMILVPKKNLQEKWEKEIFLFTRNNYPYRDNIVRSVVDDPAATPHCFPHLHLPQDAGANCYIFRNSSFSLGSAVDSEDGDSEKRWAEKLREKLGQMENSDLREMFLHGERSQAGRGNDEYLKKLFAYLLNGAMPDIDLLIVDEAHNFKHGLSRSSSIRNKLLPRFLGTIWPGCDQSLRDNGIFDENDARIFQDFPVLRERVRPKVKRLLMLSATPMDNGLHEIRNQLDIFLPVHPYRGMADDACREKMRADLPFFMIRGIMDITLHGKRLSRNMYRHEHRNGNVEKTESAPPLRVSSGRDSIVLGLVQHKIISHLQRNGGMYELGLLGAFESYAAEAGSEAENDTVSNRGRNAMLDKEILQKLNRSYQERVGGDLPHPKQDRLIPILAEFMMRSEKALVFVRRIGSVRELERKLSRRYLSHLMEKIKSIPKPPPQVQKLLETYANVELSEAAERVIEVVSERILHPLSYDRNCKAELGKILEAKNFSLEDDPDRIRRDLLNIYLDQSHHKAAGDFIRHCEYYARQGRFQRLNVNLLHSAADALARYYATEELENDEEKDEDAPDFLNRYFVQLKYRKWLSRQNWLHPNMFLLHRAFSIFDVNYDALRAGVIGMEGKSDSGKAIAVEKILASAILTEAPTPESDSRDVHPDFLTETFITSLLIDTCREEMDNWLSQRQIAPLVSAMRAKRNNCPEEGALYEHIHNLCLMLRAVFAHGSGLLPIFIAGCQEGDFSINMRHLLESHFPNVLKEVRTIIRDYHTLLAKNFSSPAAISRTLAQPSPVIGISGQHNLSVSRLAAQFRMPGYPYVVIATDILKEGEDLHTYCANIFHYGIAWNPSDMEQRTGRIDRIGSLCERRLRDTVFNDQGEVPFEDRLQVFFPYLTDTLEVNQMRKLFDELDNFIEEFYRETGAPAGRAGAYVTVDEACTPPPPQKRDLLQSKYDYGSFTGCEQANVPVFAERFTGMTRATIDAALEELKDIVCRRGCDYRQPPRVEQRVPRLVGVFAVNGNRRSQYFVNVQQVAGGGLGEFTFRLGAVVCNYNAPGVRKARQRLENEYSYSCRRVENSLVAECSTRCLDPLVADALLYELAERADKAELDFVHEDNADEVL